MANWNKDQTLHLIKLIKKYPVIYDRHCVNVHSKRTLTFQQIAKEMETIKSDTTANDVSRKFRNLKSQLHIELDRLKKNKNYKPILWCYIDLKFLIKYLKDEESYDSQEKTTVSKNTTVNKNDDINHLDVSSLSKIKWDKEQTLHLIRLIEKYPCLYDVHDSNFNRDKRKQSVVQSICNKMQQIRPNTTLTQINRRYASLRYSFKSELKRQKKNKKKIPPKLWCFEELQFLHKYFDDLSANSSSSRSSSSNRDDNFDDCWNANEVISKTETMEIERLDTVEDSNDSDFYNSSKIQQIEIVNLESENGNFSDSDLMALPSIEQTCQTKRSEASFANRNDIKKDAKQPIEKNLRLHSKDEIFIKYVISRLREIKSEDIFEDTTFKILQIVKNNIIKDK